MKPDIDLANPLVNILIEIMKIQVQKALDADRKIENSVFPIYCLSSQNNQPKHSASCVALKLKDQYFLLSASHVFDEIGDRLLLVGTGNGNALSQLGGDRFSTKRGPSGNHLDDPIDASVFHIKSNLHPEIEKRALSLEDLDAEDATGNDCIYGAVGFMCKNTRTIGNKSTVMYELLPSIEYGAPEYSLLKIDSKLQLALAYEDQVLSGRVWQTSPTPKGFSGGAIIRFSGLHVIDRNEDHEIIRPLLSAITIAQRRRNRNQPGVLIGTRIGVHLGLIHQYLPDLLPSNYFEPFDGGLNAND